MTWFKVDDGYWSNPKVMFQTLAARGLWVTAAAWSADQLTEGYFPDRVAQLIIPERRAIVAHLADELEGAGMWIRQDGGWTFHDWGDYQPTKETVERERDALRERQRRWRERRNGVSNGVTNGVTDP